MGKQRYTVAQVVKACKEGRGLVSVIAKKLGCESETVRNYAKRYPAVQEAIDEQRERLIDSAEIRLVEAVESKAEPWAIGLVLKTLGKRRGYVERTETTGADGGPIQYHDADYDVSQIPTDELRDIRSRIRPLRGPRAAPEKSA